jgi:hypothetical protein
MNAERILLIIAAILTVLSIVLPVPLWIAVLLICIALLVPLRK